MKWDDNADGMILTFEVSRGLFGIVREFLKRQKFKGMSITWREGGGLLEHTFQVKGKQDDLVAIQNCLREPKT